MPAMAAVTDLEYFDYDSSTYYNSLAERCSEYAMLAYDEMWVESSGYYYDTDNRNDPAFPALLESKLFGDGFRNITPRNYGDTNPNNVSYVLARKQVMHNGQERTLVAVIVRGTDGIEWVGNGVII